MRVEGQGRVPDFFDKDGVLYTVRKKRRTMSEGEYLSNVSSYNPNEGSRLTPKARLDAVESNNTDMSNISVDAIKNGDYGQTKLVGRLDSELQVF